MEVRAKKRVEQPEKGKPGPKQIHSRAHTSSRLPRTILVPIDLSACSPGLLQCAVAFASEVGARLIVLHVREYNITGSWAMDIARTLVSAANNVENEYAVLVGREIPPTLPVKRLLITGAPTQQIVQVALEEKADLIMLASHCRTGLDHARFGSVTEHVIRAAPCPVMIWPMRTPERARPENKGRAK